MWQFILRFIRRLFGNTVPAAAQRFERMFNEGGQRVCSEATERPVSMPPAVVCFDIAECFPLAPRDSVVWAQEFVEHALRMPGVKVRKYGAGIEFIPKFVRIERVYTRNHGFILSLKGDYRQVRELLPNASCGMWYYTRARITTKASLAAAIKCIPIAWRAR